MDTAHDETVDSGKRMQVLAHLRLLIDEILKVDDLHDHPLFHDPESVYTFSTFTPCSHPIVSTIYDGAGSVLRLSVSNKPSDEEIRQLFLCYNYARKCASELVLRIEEDPSHCGLHDLVEELQLLLARAVSIQNVLTEADCELVNAALFGTSSYISMSQDARSEILNDAWQGLTRAVQRFNPLERKPFYSFANAWIAPESTTSRKNELTSKSRDGTILNAADLLRPPQDRRLPSIERATGPHPKDIVEAIKGISEGLEDSANHVNDDVVERELDEAVGNELSIKISKTSLDKSSKKVKNPLSELDRAKVIGLLAHEKPVDLQSEFLSTFEYGHLVLWERDWIAHCAKTRGDAGTW